MEDVTHIRGSGSFWWVDLEDVWRSRNENAWRVSPATASEPALLLIFPKHFFWQVLNYLCSYLHKMLKYVRSWSNGKGSQSARPTELPLWAVGDQTWKQGKNKDLSGLVKDARTIAALQDSYSETGMKYLRTARPSQKCQNSTLVSQKIWSQIGRYLHLKPLLQLLFVCLKPIAHIHKHSVIIVILTKNSVCIWNM